MLLNKHVSKNQVAILAGGMGTRLKSRSADLPKPMVPIAGKPVLQHQIELCRKYGFNRIALLVQHKHEIIYNYFGDGSNFDVTLTYSIEETPRGTAGALHDALNLFDDTFLVLYADTFMDVDLRRIWNAHGISGADATLFLHANDHPQDSDIVAIDKNNVIININPYPHPDGLELRNLVNAALYVLNRAELENVTPASGKADIAKHMFPKMLEHGLHLNGYISPEYVKDMGTPERLDKVEFDYINGLPECLSERNLRQAVFLDRDGTINQEVNHLILPDQIELITGADTAIRRLNRSGILAVVITNQPVIARGEVSEEGMNRIHARVDKLLGAGGAYLDNLYYCPHHPDKGFSGEVNQLKIKCDCRKPDIGLINQACHDMNIRRNDSWIVGDSTSDIEAGRRSGLRTILLRTGYAGSDAKYNVRPDYFATDLLEAVDWILLGHTALTKRLAPIAVDIQHGIRLVLIGGQARAGKSYVAQVLKELMHVLGRKVHLLSLDGWLNPNSKNLGIHDRYDLKAATSAVLNVINANTRVVISQPEYELINDKSHTQLENISIGPNDLIFLEGIPSLLMNNLTCLSGVKSIYVNAKINILESRFKKYYSFIKLINNEKSYNKLNNDDISIIEQSKLYADYVVESH